MNFFNKNQIQLPLRDNSQNRKYWDKIIKEYNKLIDENTAVLKRPDKIHQYHLTANYYEIVIARIDLLIVSYSRGDNLAELKRLYNKVIEAVEQFYNLPFFSQNDNSFDSFYNYWKALCLVSLHILLGNSEAELVRILDYLGNSGRDGLFEELVSLKLANRPKTEQLLHPKPFKPLYLAIKAKGAEREKHILNFLENYYPPMREEALVRCGCWSFELATFVRELKIDDTSFAQHACYPRDLVHPTTTNE